jgi:serine protease
VGNSDFFFTPSLQTQQLFITNTGGQPLSVTITPTGAEAGRLSVAGGASVTLAAGESTTRAISCNLSGLTPGTTGAAALALTSNGGNATVNVKMRVPAPSSQSAIVALVYQDTSGEWQVAAAATAPAPDFAWTMTAPPGRYYLFGMQDANGSGRYEEGDPIGLYPNNDSPAELELSAGQTLTGLSFALAPEVSVSDDAGAVIGRACTDDAQCAPGICGTGFPGGYCTQDCATEPCPLGSRCISGESFSVCLATCVRPRTGQSNCRPGYVCEDDGTGAGVCIPACTTNADCAPQTCDTSTGYCQ